MLSDMTRKPGARLGHEVSAETRAKISAALTGRKLAGPSPLKGRKLDPELVKRRSASLRTYDTDICSIEGCERKRNALGLCGTHYYRQRMHGHTGDPPKRKRAAEATNWKGRDAGYSAVHIRARHLPKICSVCGTTEGRIEIALRHDAPPDNIKTHDGVPYSVDASDYLRMCVRCHRRYDSPRADTREPIETVVAGLPRLSPETYL